MMAARAQPGDRVRAVVGKPRIRSRLFQHDLLVAPQVPAGVDATAVGEVQDASTL